MKIGLVAPDDLSTVIFAQQFADAFQSDPDVQMVTMSEVDQFPTELALLGSRHIAIPMNRFVSPADDLKYFWRLYRAFRSEKLDAVITFTTKSNIFGILAARLAGVPVRVMAVRGLGRAFEAAQSSRDRVVNAIVHRLYRAAARSSHLVWFTTDKDRAFFVDSGVVPEPRTVMTQNAVNLRTYSWDRIDRQALERVRDEIGLQAETPSVVMVARLIWSKGVREFADAAAIVHRTHPNARFILVAPHEPDSPGAIPDEWVRERVAAGDFQWLGFRRDVLNIYALADIAVLPSYYNEGGYPRALLEPMALGKPVIAADTPVCRGPVAENENGFLVPPRDAAALADAINRLLADAELRTRFGKASLARIRERFDDRQVAREVLQRIRGIQGTRGAA